MKRLAWIVVVLLAALAGFLVLYLRTRPALPAWRGTRAAAAEASPTAKVKERMMGMVHYSDIPERVQIIGRLGLPLGQLVTVRGMWTMPFPAKPASPILIIHYVDGRLLTPPAEFDEVEPVEGRVGTATIDPFLLAIGGVEDRPAAIAGWRTGVYFQGAVEEATTKERFPGRPCGLGVRGQPTSDAFRDLGRRCHWHLDRVLAVPADPMPSCRRLPYGFNAVRRPTAHFQADAMSAGSLGRSRTLQML